MPAGLLSQVCCCATAWPPPFLLLSSCCIWSYDTPELSPPILLITDGPARHCCSSHSCPPPPALLPVQRADDYAFDPMDVTKTWPEDIFPLQVGWVAVWWCWWCGWVCACDWALLTGTVAGSSAGLAMLCLLAGLGLPRGFVPSHFAAASLHSWHLPCCLPACSPWAAWC